MLLTKRIVALALVAYLGVAAEGVSPARAQTDADCVLVDPLSSLGRLCQTLKDQRAEMERQRRSDAIVREEDRRNQSQEMLILFHNLRDELRETRARAARDAYNTDAEIKALKEEQREDRRLILELQGQLGPVRNAPFHQLQPPQSCPPGSRP